MTGSSAVQWISDYLFACHFRNLGDFRPCIWIRRPDSGWWVIWFGWQRPSLSSLKGRWEWLP